MRAVTAQLAAEFVFGKSSFSSHGWITPRNDFLLTEQFGVIVQYPAIWCYPAMEGKKVEMTPKLGVIQPFGVIQPWKEKKSS